MKRMNARPSKYRAKPTVVDGIRFASMKEAKRYQELKLLETSGEISSLELQPRFDLHAPSAYISTNKIKVGRYVADFRYVERGVVVIEDVKGMKTPMYNWKKKHAEIEYGIEINEI